MKAKIYLTLRIVFCILAVAFCAAAVFIFTYFDWWGMLCVFGAALCAALMLIFRRLHDAVENEEAPSPAAGDFITGPVAPDVRDDVTQSESDGDKA